MPSEVTPVSKVFEKTLTDQLDLEERYSQQKSGAKTHPAAGTEAYGRVVHPEQERERVLAVSQIMKFPIFSLSPDAAASQAEAMMRENGFRHVLVVSSAGELVGMISDRDIARVSCREHFGDPPVGALMSRDLWVAAPQTSIREAAALMLEHRVSALPVCGVGEGKRPIGIVTVTDVLRAVMAHAPLELWR